MSLRCTLVLLLALILLPAAVSGADPASAAPEAAQPEAATAPTPLLEFDAGAPGCPAAVPMSKREIDDPKAPGTQECQYTCPFGFCPDFPDRPPATCENGCCVYPICGGGECDFPWECPPFHDCLAGCCIHQT
jgi:hypothetical protein